MENILLLQSEYEWPFLKEVAAGEGGSAEGEGEGEEEGQQERLLCDALIGEPFYYRVRPCSLAVRSGSVVFKLTTADGIVQLTAHSLLRLLKAGG